MNSFILTGSGVAGMAMGRPFTVTDSHHNYAAIIAALKAKEYDRIHDLINVAAALARQLPGEQFTERVTIDAEGGNVFVNGEPVHGVITQRICEMLEAGFDVMPMALFLDNLSQNPSKAAIDELYMFLECGKMPITEDGHFIAWKRVRDDMKSYHDGTTEHVFGEVLSMPRERCNPNRNETCSAGLHFCSQTYLSQYHGGDGRVLILKINPRDVVSIPSDYNNAKGRACAYIPIGELDGDARTRAEQAKMETAPVVFTVGAAEDEPFVESEFTDPVDEGVVGTDAKPTDPYTDGFQSGVNARRLGESSLYEILLTRVGNQGGYRPEYFNAYQSTALLELTDFGKGYIAGYEQYGRAWSNVKSQLNPVVTAATTLNASSDFIDGYKAGYKAGKAKTSAPLQARNDWEDGYNAGAKDGRGHKPKLYK